MLEIPSELLTEIFRFLSRNEAEKCQLVSHQWDRIVTRIPALPLFEFYCLDIDRKRKRKCGDDSFSKSGKFLPMDVLVYRYPNSPGIRVVNDVARMKMLKNVFFAKIFNYKNPSKTVVEIFEKMVQVMEEKLFAKELVYWGRDVRFLSSLLNCVSVVEEVKLRRFETPAHFVWNDRISMQVWKADTEADDEKEEKEQPLVWFNFEYALWSLNKKALNYFLMEANGLVDVENDEVHVYLPHESIDIFMQILVEVR